MLYNRLGNSGLVVSRLSLGAMTFTQQGVGMMGIAKTGAAAADELVGRAIDAGVNFFDTADIYSAGESETMLASALAGRRDSVVIATKVGFPTGRSPTHGGLTRKHILWSIDESLRRLGTDHVDVYVAHKEDRNTPLEETLDAFDAVVKSGKARYLGFSNWPAWKVAAAMEIQRANGWAPFSHGQLYYSLLGRSIEHEMLPMCARYGLGITAWSPLAGGFLSGKYRREAEISEGDRRATMDFPPIDRSLGFELIDAMEKIARVHDASVAQVALAWLLTKNVVSSIIIGASKLAQLEDNLGAAGLHLEAEEIETLDAMTRTSPAYPIFG